MSLSASEYNPSLQSHVGDSSLGVPPLPSPATRQLPHTPAAVPASHPATVIPTYPPAAVPTTAPIARVPLQQLLPCQLPPRVPQELSIWWSPAHQLPHMFPDGHPCVGCSRASPFSCPSDSHPRLSHPQQSPLSQSLPCVPRRSPSRHPHASPTVPPHDAPLPLPTHHCPWSPAVPGMRRVGDRDGSPRPALFPPQH